MNINVIKSIVIGCIIVVIVILLVLFSPWLVLMLGGQLSPNPHAPQITHGEFPFRLEYEINGEIHVVEDTLICDFDGYGFSEGKGEKFRKWKARLESGTNRITLLKVDDIEILFFPVSPDSSIGGIYMGDDSEYYPGDASTTFPDALYTTDDFDDKRARAYIITSNEMMGKYKIKLIRWESSSPIENNFK